MRRVASASATDTLALARERGLESTSLGGAVALALGVAMARQGRVEEAEPWLERALRYLGVPAGTLLQPTPCCGWRRSAVRSAGTSGRARSRGRRAPIAVGSADPGALPELLREVERALDMRSKRRLAEGDMPSEAELRVLRLLAGTVVPQRDRRRALRLAQHRQDPDRCHQPQARDLDAERGGGTSAGAGPDLTPAAGAVRTGWRVPADVSPRVKRSWVMCRPARAGPTMPACRRTASRSRES